MWEELLAAISSKNEAEALRLIDQMKPEDFSKDYTGNNCFRIPLHSAIYEGLEKVVNKLLVVTPLLSGVVDNSGRTALHMAAEKGNEQIFDKLLELKPDLIGDVTRGSHTVLHGAAQFGSEAIVSKLLSFKPDLNCVNNEDKTAIHLAVIRGNVPIVSKLLSFKPDLIEVLDKKGQTLLHHAALIGQEAMVNKLLSVNSNLEDIVDKEGRTALSLAASSWIQYRNTHIIGHVNQIERDTSADIHCLVACCFTPKTLNKLKKEAENEGMEKMLHNFPIYYVKDYLNAIIYSLK